MGSVFASETALAFIPVRTSPRSLQPGHPRYVMGEHPGSVLRSNQPPKTIQMMEYTCHITEIENSTISYRCDLYMVR